MSEFSCEEEEAFSPDVCAADVAPRVQVKHYGWPETLVHDQGPEFMGSSKTRQELRVSGPCLLIHRVPGKMEKQREQGQSFKHQLWDMDEECCIEGKMEFEAAIAECCDARKTASATGLVLLHLKVFFGSSLRLPDSLLRDDRIDRQFLSADPYTDFATYQ